KFYSLNCMHTITILNWISDVLYSVLVWARAQAGKWNHDIRTHRRTTHQGLPRWRRDPGPRWRQPHHQSRRQPRHHGPLRLGQDHPAALPGRDHHSHFRPGELAWPRDLSAFRRRTHPPTAHGLRVRVSVGATTPGTARG